MNRYNWDFNDFSHDALITRANYLTEVIDKIPCKATYRDIESLPEGRLTIPWGPASGKSTAIRQYLVKHQMDYIIFATAKKSDVDSMYYDLIAMQEAGYIVKECIISKFHSNYDPGETELRHSNILVCTHERLMIEPPSILYRLEGDISNHVGQVIRSEMIIDELPKFYKSFKLDETMMMGLSFINEALLDQFQYDRKQRVAYRYSKFKKMISAYFRNALNELTPSEYAAVRGLIKSYHSSNITVTEPDERSIRKFAYFSDLLAEKLLELTKEKSYAELLDQNLYYTLLDIEVPSIKIFDGTGDLILRGSSYWTSHPSRKYPRSIQLKNYPITLSDTKMLRKVSTMEDLNYTMEKIDSLLNHIRNILATSDGKILLYTWKSIRLQQDYYFTEDNKQYYLDSLPDYIHKSLSAEENSRLEIIYYGSGKERVTSEYSECDSIIIAGKFFIPNSAISSYNEVNSTDITSLDYTKALIIQAIYRTSARQGKPITVYFTDDYPSSLIDSVMQEFHEVIINDKNCTGYYLLSSQMRINSRNVKYYEYLAPHLNTIYNEGYVELLVPEDNNRSASSTRDFKLSISRLIRSTPIHFENIKGTNKFILRLQKG